MAIMLMELAALQRLPQQLAQVQATMAVQVQVQATMLAVVIGRSNSIEWHFATASGPSSTVGIYQVESANLVSDQPWGCFLALR